MSYLDELLSLAESVTEGSGDRKLLDWAVGQALDAESLRQEVSDWRDLAESVVSAVDSFPEAPVWVRGMVGMMREIREAEVVPIGDPGASTDRAETLALLQDAEGGVLRRDRDVLVGVLRSLLVQGFPASEGVWTYVDPDGTVEIGRRILALRDEDEKVVRRLLDGE